MYHVSLVVSYAALQATSPGTASQQPCESGLIFSQPYNTILDASYPGDYSNTQFINTDASPCDVDTSVKPLYMFPASPSTYGMAKAFGLLSPLKSPMSYALKSPGPMHHSPAPPAATAAAAAAGAYQGMGGSTAAGHARRVLNISQPLAPNTHNTNSTAAGDGNGIMSNRNSMGPPAPTSTSVSGVNIQLPIAALSTGLPASTSNLTLHPGSFPMGHTADGSAVAATAQSWQQQLQSPYVLMPMQLSGSSSQAPQTTRLSPFIPLSALGSAPAGAAAAAATAMPDVQTQADDEDGIIMTQQQLDEHIGHHPATASTAVHEYRASAQQQQLPRNGRSAAAGSVMGKVPFADADAVKAPRATTMSSGHLTVIPSIKAAGSHGDNRPAGGKHANTGTSAAAGAAAGGGGPLTDVHVNKNAGQMPPPSYGTTHWVLGQHGTVGKDVGGGGGGTSKYTRGSAVQKLNRQESHTGPEYVGNHAQQQQQQYDSLAGVDGRQTRAPKLHPKTSQRRQRDHGAHAAVNNDYGVGADGQQQGGAVSGMASRNQHWAGTSAAAAAGGAVIAGNLASHKYEERKPKAQPGKRSGRVRMSLQQWMELHKVEAAEYGIQLQPGRGRRINVVHKEADAEQSGGYDGAAAAVVLPKTKARKGSKANAQHDLHKPLTSGIQKPQTQQQQYKKKAVPSRPPPLLLQCDETLDDYGKHGYDNQHAGGGQYAHQGRKQQQLQQQLRQQQPQRQQHHDPLASMTLLAEVAASPLAAGMWGRARKRNRNGRAVPMRKLGAVGGQATGAPGVNQDIARGDEGQGGTGGRVEWDDQNRMQSGVAKSKELQESKGDGAYQQAYKGDSVELDEGDDDHDDNHDDDDQDDDYYVGGPSPHAARSYKKAATQMVSTSSKPTAKAVAGHKAGGATSKKAITVKLTNKGTAKPATATPTAKRLHIEDVTQSAQKLATGRPPKQGGNPAATGAMTNKKGAAKDDVATQVCAAASAAMCRA